MTSHSRYNGGRSLGRYDDGLQNVANGFTDLIRDEEVLERLEKPVGSAPKALHPGKGRRFKSGRPHQNQVNRIQALLENEKKTCFLDQRYDN